MLLFIHNRQYIPYHFSYFSAILKILHYFYAVFYAIYLKYNVISPLKIAFYYIIFFYFCTKIYYHICYNTNIYTIYPFMSYFFSNIYGKQKKEANPYENISHYFFNYTRIKNICSLPILYILLKKMHTYILHNTKLLL